LKVTGLVYARQIQPSEFDAEQLKSFDSMGDVQDTVPSANVALQKSISHSKQIKSDENSTKVEMLIASAIQPQQSKMKSLNAGMIEDGLHRARFDSLFRSETIKIDQDTVSHAAARESSEAGAVPKLLLKRKAAWSGIVGIRGTDATNVNRVEHSTDVIGSEVEPPRQNTAVDLQAVRLQFRQQRYAMFGLKNLSECAEYRIRRRSVNDVSQQNNGNQASDISQHVSVKFHID